MGKSLYATAALVVATSSAVAFCSTLLTSTSAAARDDSCINSNIACLNRCDDAFKWGSANRKKCYKGCKGLYDICLKVELEPSAFDPGSPQPPQPGSKGGLQTAPTTGGILDSGPVLPPTGPASTGHPVAGGVVAPSGPSLR